jgi:serine/threonine protein phosphatase 1
MRTELAFVGDIHGNLPALQGLWDALVRRDVQHVVFLGDYINKGPQSADVLEELVSFAQARRATFLAGNHETALSGALDSGDLSAFLKIGGAATIRSYVGGRVGPDVFSEFAAAIPQTHLELLRHMPLRYETDDLIAQHLPPPTSTSKFRISAHSPVGAVPRMSPRSAQLDTGCGTNSGRLTALMWPTLDYIQVDGHGLPVLR